MGSKLGKSYLFTVSSHKKLMYKLGLILLSTLDLHFNSLRAGYFFMLLLALADFFQNKLFLKKNSGTLSECQTTWIQIKTDLFSALIWVQTVCRGYKQTTKVTSKQGAS